MAAGTITTAQRRVQRAEYDRLFRSTRPARKVRHIALDDATVVTRDPMPCGYCGVRGDVACRHRPWIGA